MKRAPGAAAELGPGVQTQISALRGDGQPLAPALRAFFEPRFGHDFSRVRIHRGARSAGLARGINAQAFTLGHNLVLGQGRNEPGSSRGDRLLADELCHVVQNDTVPVVRRQVTP